MLGLQWLQHTRVLQQELQFKQHMAALELPNASQRLPMLAVVTVVPTHFVLGSSACRERTAPILCFSLHDLLRGWLLPFLDLCSVSVHDCFRVDMSCVSQVDAGSAAAPSPAFPPVRLQKAVLPELRACWAALRRLSRFHFSSLSSSALTSSSESLCA